MRPGPTAHILPAGCCRQAQSGEGGCTRRHTLGFIQRSLQHWSKRSTDQPKARTNLRGRKEIEKVSRNITTKRVVLAVGGALLMSAFFAVAAFAVDNTTSFKMVRSQAAVDNECLKGA